MDKHFLQTNNSSALIIPERQPADSKRVENSPSGKFQIIIYRYSEDRHSWNHTHAIIKCVDNHRKIAEIRRQHGHFCYAWVPHTNGHEYFICGLDNQAYSVINLRTGLVQAYTPEKGSKSFGFSWASIYPSPDGLMLAVDGSAWATPNELVFYDFSMPEKLPLNEIDFIDNLDQCQGWLDNYTFSLRREIEIRGSDGVPYNLLTEDEQELLDKDHTLLEYKFEFFQYKRDKAW